MSNICKTNIDLLQDNFLYYCRGRLNCQNFNGKLSFDLMYDITSTYKRYYSLYKRNLSGYITINNGKTIFVTEHDWG